MRYGWVAIERMVYIQSTMQKDSNKRAGMKHQKQQKQKQKGKKKQEEVASESESSENADIDLNQIGEGQQMEVSFIVGEIQEDYYHSLKTILLRYAQITKTTNSEVADAVVANRTIGNVVLADDDQQEQDQDEQEEEDDGVQDDEENVYSVLSVLAGKNATAKKIRSLVLKLIEKKDFPEEIINILKDPSTGVLLNERLANLPAFVACSTHEVFKRDMADLKQKDQKRYSELFGKWLLNVSEVQFQGEEQLDKLIYSKFEDYELCHRARVWWLGGTNASHRKKADMRNLYYLITPQNYFEAVDNFKSYLQQQ